jgi:hypothetical protein
VDIYSQPKILIYPMAPLFLLIIKEEKKTIGWFGG